MSGAGHANRVPRQGPAETSKQEQVEAPVVHLWSTEYVPISSGRPQSQRAGSRQGGSGQGHHRPPVVRLNKASLMRLQAAHTKEPPLAAGLTALLLQKPTVDAQQQALEVLAKLSQAAFSKASTATIRNELP
jgi:hypothetical protein